MVVLSSNHRKHRKSERAILFLMFLLARIPKIFFNGIVVIKMVKIKDINITYEKKEEHENKDIYIQIEEKLIKTTWITNVENKIILHTN